MDRKSSRDDRRGRPVCDRRRDTRTKATICRDHGADTFDMVVEKEPI